MRIIRSAALALPFLFASPQLAQAAPQVLYTDIISGPNSGGEGNLGAYLSIFGKGFGSGSLGSGVKVYLNDVEVSRYILLSTSKGRSDIQQISVQIGAVGNPAAGTPVPIKVVVRPSWSTRVG